MGDKASMKSLDENETKNVKDQEQALHGIDEGEIKPESKMEESIVPESTVTVEKLKEKEPEKEERHDFDSNTEIKVKTEEGDVVSQDKQESDKGDQMDKEKEETSQNTENVSQEKDQVEEIMTQDSKAQIEESESTVVEPLQETFLKEDSFTGEPKEKSESNDDKVSTKEDEHQSVEGPEIQVEIDTKHESVL